MLITRNALETVGRFDATLFAYYEDFDFCVRARRAGFRIRFVPQAISWHRFAGSTGADSPLRLQLLARNHLTIIGRYAAPWLAPALLVGIATYRATVRALLRLATRQPALALAEVRGSSSGFFRGLVELARRTHRFRGTPNADVAR